MFSKLPAKNSEAKYCATCLFSSNLDRVSMTNRRKYFVFRIGLCVDCYISNFRSNKPKSDWCVGFLHVYLQFWWFYLRSANSTVTTHISPLRGGGALISYKMNRWNAVVKSDFASMWYGSSDRFELTRDQSARTNLIWWTERKYFWVYSYPHICGFCVFVCTICLVKY